MAAHKMLVKLTPDCSSTHFKSRVTAVPLRKCDFTNLGKLSTLVCFCSSWQHFWLCLRFVLKVFPLGTDNLNTGGPHYFRGPFTCDFGLCEAVA